MTTVPTADPQTSQPTPPSRAGTLALLVIASAQLMVVLDNTIVNIALPSIQADFGVGPSTLSWIVNAYALAFGGLLLLGGRIGDLFGRRAVFRIGIIVFALASLFGGFAANEQMLITARVLQGVGGAIVAPTALSLIATTFAEGKERGRAMGVYAAMAGVGSTIGLLLGGVLTDYLDWRWVMFVNVPIAAVVLLGSRVLPAAGRREGRLDVPGAITGTLGLVGLVYGITRGGEDGWTDPWTLACFAAAVVLLSLFVLLQSRSTHPMLPLRLVRDRNRAGANVTMLFVGSAMFAMFYFLTLYLQQVLAYSPVKAGLAFLPFSAGIMVAAGVVGPKLAERLPPRMIAVPGLALAAAGLLWFATLSPDSSYWTHLAPAMLITSFGLGTAFLPLTLGAVSGTTEEDAGIASALLNAAQQIGGALGLAVLSTVATSAANNALDDADAAYFQGLATGDQGLMARAADALTDGYTAAFAVGGGLLLAGLVVAATLITTKDRAGADTAGAHMG